MALEDSTNQAIPKVTNKKSKKKDELLSAAVPTEGIADLGLTDEADALKTTNLEASNESPFIKELHRNIRNVSKKLSAMAKLDAVVAENPDMTLDELVAARKINSDQKAQALKKPALQAQLTQLEEQVVQYKKFEEDFLIQVAKERARLEATHQQELEDLRSTVKAEAVGDVQQLLRQSLLTLSKFLRAAAARRQVEDDLSEESKAFEGLLLLLYGGDNMAVSAAEKLINGSEEGVVSTDEQILSVSYAKIKDISDAYAPFAAEEAWRQEVAEADPSDVPPDTATERVIATDPTVAHAGLTEIEDSTPAEPVPQPVSIEPGDIDTSAANIAASSWDNGAGSASQDAMADSWVSVPRNPLEVENHTNEVLNDGTPKWADEPAEPALVASAATPPPQPPNDGFHEVHHGRHPGRGRGGRGRGGFRGDANGHRGRGGFRGDRGGEFRGRGRGGGPRGAPRGPST